MTSAEAKKIVDPNGTFAKDDPARIRAEGFLNCWAVIEKLVDALHSGPEIVVNGARSYANDAEKVEKALALYDKIKGKA